MSGNRGSVVLISRGQDPAKDEKPFGQVRRQPQFAGRGRNLTPRFWRIWDSHKTRESCTAAVKPTDGSRYGGASRESAKLAQGSAERDTHAPLSDPGISVESRARASGKNRLSLSSRTTPASPVTASRA